jgi:hypothetical protein
MATNQDNRRRGGSRSARGFAAMDDDLQRRIAKKGGQASARSQVRDKSGHFAGSRDGSGGGSRGQAAGGGATR